MVRWLWVIFQSRASYSLDIVGQGPSALAVGAGGGCLDIFALIYPFSPLSPSLWKTARYRLKYCLEGPLNQKQPTNKLSVNPLVNRYLCRIRKGYGCEKRKMGYAFHKQFPRYPHCPYGYGKPFPFFNLEQYSNL